MLVKFNEVWIRSEMVVSIRTQRMGAKYWIIATLNTDPKSSECMLSRADTQDEAQRIADEIACAVNKSNRFAVRHSSTRPSAIELYHG